MVDELISVGRRVPTEGDDGVPARQRACVVATVRSVILLR
jgi:hypothetical protein